MRNSTERRARANKLESNLTKSKEGVLGTEVYKGTCYECFGIFASVEHGVPRAERSRSGRACLETSAGPMVLVVNAVMSSFAVMSKAALCAGAWMQRQTKRNEAHILKELRVNTHHSRIVDQVVEPARRTENLIINVFMRLSPPNTR